MKPYLDSGLEVVIAHNYSIYARTNKMNAFKLLFREVGRNAGAQRYFKARRRSELGSLFESVDEEVVDTEAIPGPLTSDLVLPGKKLKMGPRSYRR